MSFLPEAFVRYVSHGPRQALAGAIGVVSKATAESEACGWVRVCMAGRTEDYAEDELEPASYWSFLSNSANKWHGPFTTWKDAVASLSDDIRRAVLLPPGHPLSVQMERLIADLGDSDPVVAGIVGYHPSAGEARIVVAGVSQPTLHDKYGKRYA